MRTLTIAAACPTADVRAFLKRLEEFIGRYYNQCRLRSALGFRSPVNFEEEAHAKQRPAYAAAAMTFIDG